MSSEGRTRARFRVLGPVGFQTDTENVVLTGKQGALLTILLLSANHVVSVQRLAELLWGEPLPSSPSSRVRMLVSDLRKTCIAAGNDLIRTQRPGYVVRLTPDQLDLVRFLDCTAHARKATARGDPEAAVTRYDEALRLWHGAPLVGIDGSFVPAEAARLQGLRLEALEERGAAMLAMGRYAEAIAELTAVVTDHPLREAAHGQLMLALYRSGRRADALAVYRSLRERTTEELGLEPEHDLQRLHHRILTSDATAEAPDTAPEQSPRQPRPMASPVPRQLPAPPPHFVGREREHAELDRLARDRTGNSVAIAAISGTGEWGRPRWPCAGRTTTSASSPTASSTSTSTGSPRAAARCRLMWLCAIFSALSASRRRPSPPGRRPRQGSTGRWSRAAACLSCLTTPATWRRSSRSSPAARAAWWWSPAATASLA
ncbi:BTAD domain-containing putative transcriptional regulator [Nonomuraea antimicrobica]